MIHHLFIISAILFYATDITAMNKKRKTTTTEENNTKKQKTALPTNLIPFDSNNNTNDENVRITSPKQSPQREKLTQITTPQQQETYSAFARLKEKTQELYPNETLPSNDNFKDALQLLSADDRYTIFDAYVNNHEYKNAIFISNTMEEYFPAYLVLQSTEYFMKAVEEMDLLPSTVPINRECLKETMRHAHMMKREYYDKRLQKSLIQTFNNAIEEDQLKDTFNHAIDARNYAVALDLAIRYLFDYRPENIKPQLEANKDWYNQLFREKLQQYIEYDAYYPLKNTLFFPSIDATSR